MKPVLLSLLVMMTVCSCGVPEEVTSEELKQFVLAPEHDLVKTVTKNGITLEIMFRPKDLVIAQQVGISDKAKWDEEKLRIDSLDYFVLKISRDGAEVQNSLAGDPGAFTRAVSYLSSDIGKDISLIAGKDIVQAEDFSFVPTFGTSNSTGILLIFKSYLKKRNRDFTITFEDPVFGSGQTEFEFDIHDIRKVPTLRTTF